MADEEVYKNYDFKEVTFRITLSDITNFKVFVSKEYYIRGNPWVIEFKKFEDVDKSTKLGIYLRSKVMEESKNWTIIAQLSATVMSSNDDVKPLKTSSPPCAFHSKSGCWGSKVCLWNELTDPKNGFITEDEVNLDITVKASPMQDFTKEDLMKFEHLRRCCDDCTTGKFRITVKKSDEFQAVCSPEFILGGFSWRLFVSKAKKIGDEYLRITALGTSVAKNASFQMKISSQLISSDPSVDPVKMETKIAWKPERDKIYHNLAKWNQVFSQGNKFIQNGSFIIEIQMEIEEVEGQEAITQPMYSRCENGPVESNCSICFENLFDRDISSTFCGHVFCTACIEGALRKRKFCPFCNEAATPTEIRKLFLPKE